MSNPFEFMMRGEHYNKVLQAAAESTDEELALAVSHLHAEQMVEIAVYTSTTCRKFAVKQTLITGCLFHLFAIAVEADGRQEFFDNLLDDLKISRTQAYRCRAVWCCFGAKFLAEPQLPAFFVTEALKILSAEETPQAARDEALELARRENRISIKVAESLVRKHSVDLVPNAGENQSQPQSETTSVTSGNAARSSKGWLFSGSLVRIQLLPKIRPDRASIEALIRDLESAIAALQSRTSQTPAAQARPV